MVSSDPDPRAFVGLFDQLIFGHPVVLVVLIFVLGTEAGILRFGDRSLRYGLYHSFNAGLFLLLWMVFSAACELDSFWVLMGIGLGGYLGPFAIDGTLRVLIRYVRARWMR